MLFWQKLKCERDIFLLAVGFLTRLPIPAVTSPVAEKLNAASRYFVVVGFIIGLLAALVFTLTNAVWGHSIAVIMAIAAGLLITGVFHEDGLADTLDGFGGGWTLQQKLNIMKDSRIGSYGAVGLWSTLTLKAVLLVQIEHVAVALMLGHSLSRLVPVVLMFLLPYVQDIDVTKVKPMAQPSSIQQLVIVVLSAVVISLIFSPNSFITLSVILLAVAFCYIWFKHQIGGYTGDTLGASQQVAELFVLFSLAT